MSEKVQQMWSEDDVSQNIAEQLTELDGEEEGFLVQPAGVSDVQWEKALKGFTGIEPR